MHFRKRQKLDGEEVSTASDEEDDPRQSAVVHQHIHGDGVI